MRIIPQVILTSNKELNAEISFKSYQSDADMDKMKIQLTHHVLVLFNVLLTLKKK